MYILVRHSFHLSLPKLGTKATDARHAAVAAPVEFGGDSGIRGPAPAQLRMASIRRKADSLRLGGYRQNRRF